MSDTAEHPLNNEIDHWFGVTRLRYQQVLESLTELDLAASRRHFDLFSRLLLATLDFSSERLEETTRDEADTTLDSDHNDDTNMIRADHMILRRSLPKVSDAIDELIQMAADRDLRSSMVDRLDTFVRLANILERHQDRSWEILGPRLEQHFNLNDGRALAEQLSDSMQRAQPN